MLYSPLEQFRINKLIGLNIGQIDFSITNSAVYLLVMLLIYTYISMTVLGPGKLIPNTWQRLLEELYKFINTMVRENIGTKGEIYLPLVFTIFTFITLTNVLGMIPYSFTPTSHMIVTFGLSLSLFIGITIIGFTIHGLSFFSFFMPGGAPIQLAPLLVGIEIISYLSRGVSLAIRLFANMMSGHTLLKIIASFIWSMATYGGILMIVALIPFAILVCLTFLEFGIAILQGYVFTILVCIYLHDSIYLH